MVKGIGRKPAVERISSALGLNDMTSTQNAGNSQSSVSTAIRARSRLPMVKTGILVFMAYSSSRPSQSCSIENANIRMNSIMAMAAA